MALLRLLVSCLVAAASGLLFLLSVTFGSGGFGGSLQNEHEALAQTLLVLAAIAPASLLWIAGSKGWVIIGLQFALVLLGVRLGN